MELAKKIEVHYAIVAGRIRWENNNYKLLSNWVGYRQVRKLFFN